MAQPLFSIILPTCNAAASISACLNSIVNQNFHDWEIILMDAVSNDETIEIVKRYKENYPMIQIFSKKDDGIFDAMNQGLEKATGEWLFFIGSDDYLFDNNVLSKVAAVIGSNVSLNVIYGNVYSERFGGQYDGSFNFLKILYKNICHQSMFLRKDVFEYTGLFNLKYRAQADWDHNLKWMLSSKTKKMYIPVIIAHYADGGYSSVTGDELFERDRFRNYLLYSKGNLSLSQRLIVAGRETIKALIRLDRQRLRRSWQFLKERQ